ncbi:VanZ family protein [Mycobacterium sp. CBMA271]|uniref:VanZ family protein n=1 Tax=unclassified Mycobacteroides TaxID=2618759 RepID=UPI0012DE39EB|nr:MULTISPECIES: VanZ family protein [unclassified Mycobacteroides]MUM19510.1 hypothetical protein [Mycobacteroides sp. CBMA 326]MUM20332.1 VanZ family protein [Mycobacteroides sp. CBMA 271]
MWGTWERWGSVWIGAAATIPVVVLLVVACALWRTRSGWERRWAWVSSATEIGAVAGTVPWVWMILTPAGGTRSVQWMPFADLAALRTADVATVVEQVGGNLLVFAAAGFFLPIRFRIGLWAVVGLAACSSVLVEVLQFILDIGRVSSVDDVLLNAAGAGLAALCSRPWWRCRW